MFLWFLVLAGMQMSSQESIECYKYEARSGYLFKDVPDVQKETKWCPDKCLGYFCYKNGGFLIGNGCLQDATNACTLTTNMVMQLFFNSKEEAEDCPSAQNVLMSFCDKPYCNGEHFRKCVSSIF